MAFGDPFDVTNTDVPAQNGGASPDFYRNLALFGSAMALGANQRTAQGFLANGPGFAGPFAAGIQGAMQGNMDIAKARSNLGLQNAQTQGVALGNYEKMLNLPVLQQRARMQQQFYQDPQGFMRSMGMGPQDAPAVLGPQSSAAPAEGAGPQIAGSPYARGIATMESNGKSDAQNPNWSVANGGPLGPHQFTADTWNAFRQENPQYFANMTPEQAMSARTDPQLSATATDWLARKNAGVLQQSGIPATPQNLGIAHTLGGAGAASVLKFPDQAPLSQVFQVTQPNAAQQILTQNPQYAKMTVGDLKRKYSGLSAPGDGRVQYAQAGNVATDASTAPAPQQPQQPSQPQPQPQQAPAQQNIGSSQALATAQHYEQQANQIEMMHSLGLPMPGDPAALRQAAQQYRTLGLAGSEAGAKAAAELPYVGPKAAAVAAAELPYAGPKAAAVSQAELPARLAQLGFRYDQSGQLAPISGGPADPSYVGAKAAAEAAAKAQVELQTAGPITRQKAMNSNLDLRPGGMALVQTPNGPQWIKNPQLEEVQGPNGVTNYVHISPPLPGSPDGTPGTSSPVVDDNGQPAIKKIPKQVQEGLDKSYDEFNGKGADSYIAAKNTQGWLEQMDHAAETLNQAGGFLTTGPTAPERIAFAGHVNDVLRTMGLPTAFDPKAVGAWEELKKATTTAGFELSSHYEGHARQAAATIENATSAVPSAANSPVGYYTVSAGIREAAQSAADMREFAQAPVAQKGGDINQAAIDFYKTITPQMYARRAISNVQPYPVKSDTELSRYLPGTFIQYKGNVVQVPERPGAPPIPAYLKNAHPMVPTQ